jgi:hypothetical protein
MEAFIRPKGKEEDMSDDETENSLRQYKEDNWCIRFGYKQIIWT